MVTLSLSLSVSFSSSLWLVLGFREFHQTCDEADASDYLAIIVITVEHSQHHSTSDPHGKCGWGKGMISRWLNYTFIALLCDFEGIIFIRRVSLSLSLSLSFYYFFFGEGRSLPTYWVQLARVLLELSLGGSLTHRKIKSNSFGGAESVPISCGFSRLSRTKAEHQG